MQRDVTDEELAAALAAAEDDDGVDQRLAAMTEAMTTQEREHAQESIRRWIEATRDNRERQRAERKQV